MGCCNNSQRVLQLKELQDIVKTAIDMNNIGIITRLFIQHPFLDINDCFLSSTNLNFNPLGYSLFIAKVECFNFLYKNMGAHLDKMEELFNQQGYRGIDIICIQGTLPMLKVYLPICLSLKTDEGKSSTSKIQETINFGSCHSINLTEDFSNTPIQYACIYGNLQIIKYIYEYFYNDAPPTLFDINYQDEITGENCPLIACRLGLYKIMRFLYEECNGNFHVKNVNNENAILILAIGSKTSDSYDYYLCMKYLLETIKVDPTYMYEDVVLVIANYELLELYYRALIPFEIFPDKLQLERLNRIKAYQYENQDYSEYTDSIDIQSGFSMLSSMTNELSPVPFIDKPFDGFSSQ